jgi:hypothetical protein
LHFLFCTRRFFYLTHFPIVLYEADKLAHEEAIRNGGVSHSIQFSLLRRFNTR